MVFGCEEDRCTALERWTALLHAYQVLNNPVARQQYHADHRLSLVPAEHQGPNPLPSRVVNALEDSERSGPAACGGHCGHRYATQGKCGCNEQRCGCGNRWKPGTTEQARQVHYSQEKNHGAWVQNQNLIRCMQMTLQRHVVPGALDISPVPRMGYAPIPAPDCPAPEPVPEPQVVVEEDDDSAIHMCDGYIPDGLSRGEWIDRYPWVRECQAEPSRPWVVMEGLKGLRHVSCSGQEGRKSQANTKAHQEARCDKCHCLRYNNPLKRVMDIASEPPAHTPYQYLGFRALKGKVAHYESERTRTLFSMHERERHIAPLRRQCTLFDRLVTCIRHRSVARLRTIVCMAFDRGWSWSRIVGLLEDAVRANNTQYSAEEKTLAIILHELAGPAVVHILHAMGTGPSASHAARLARAAIGAVTADINVELATKAWSTLAPTSVILHADEISVKPQLTVTKARHVTGLCECATEPVPFNRLEDLEDLLDKLQKGEWHLAKYARVMALSRQDKENYHCIPIQAIPSCNRFDATDEVDRVRAVIQKWAPHCARYGSIVEHGTDGDSRRRRAFHMMTVDVKTREDMPLFQRLELEDDSQPSKDQRHLTKRVARLIMRGTLSIGGHPLSLDVLVNLAHALGMPHVATKLERTKKEKDFMSVPVALDVLNALSDIAAADHESLDPSRYAQASTVRRLHWFVKHTDGYYYQNGRSVEDRLVSAAAASVHLMQLYRQSKCFSEWLYTDLQIEFSGVFEAVHAHQEKYPDKAYVICLHGNDEIEKMFSVCRMGKGTGGVLDYATLCRRLSSTALTHQLMADNPEWAVKRKRKRYGDNMNPRTANLEHSGPLDLATIWCQGVAMAENELAMDAGALLRLPGDIGIFSPFGTCLVGRAEVLDVGEDEEEAERRRQEAAADEAAKEQEEATEEEDVPAEGDDDPEHLFENSDRVLVDGQWLSKQQALNLFINKPINALTGRESRERLRHAISASRAAVPLPMAGDKESWPMVGDPFMALAAFKGENGQEVVSAGIFSLRAIVGPSGACMDVLPDVVEASEKMMVDV